MSPRSLHTLLQEIEEYNALLKKQSSNTLSLQERRRLNELRGLLKETFPGQRDQAASTAKHIPSERPPEETKISELLMDLDTFSSLDTLNPHFFGPDTFDETHLHQSSPPSQKEPTSFSDSFESEFYQHPFWEEESLKKK
jgi:hypothetical protein